MTFSMNKAFIAAAGLAVLADPVAAEQSHCKLYPKYGLLMLSYDLVGPEACKTACVETETCTGWSYTPHTFNPKTAPGQCRLMAEVHEEVPDNREFCGRL